MNVNFIIGGTIGCALVAVLLVKLYQSKVREGQSNEEILEQSFGTMTYASVFSLAEVRAWITSRDEMLTTASKATVLKINDQTLNSIGKNIGLRGSVDNMIVIAIVDAVDKKITASSLVKYEKLDAQLDTMLEQGKGILVIER